MKESHGEGVATHTDPESCGAACEGSVEALTGAHAGRVLSRGKVFLQDADALDSSGRQHSGHRQREMLRGPARSQTPRMHGTTSHENREIRCPPEAEQAEGRVGKSKDASRR